MKENPIEEGNETTPVEPVENEAPTPGNIIVLEGGVESGLLQISEEGFTPALLIDLKLGILLPDEFSYELAKALGNLSKLFKVKRNRVAPTMRVVKGGRK